MRINHFIFSVITSTLLLVSTSSFANLKVSEAKVRLLPPGLPNTSAYFTIENTGNKDRVLISASSEIANKVELHSHVMKDGMMRMRQQDKVIIPAGEKVEFAPGGLHLMIFGLNEPLRVNQQVKLNVITQDGETLVVNGTVTLPGNEKTGKEKHKHHNH